MKNILDKIALTLVSKIAHKTLNVNDIEVESYIALFEQYSDLKDYFLNTTWEIPSIVDSQEGILHVPSVNILFLASRMTVNSYLQTCVWNTFKEDVEYFKEVYFIDSNNNKHLIHGLDIVTFSQKTIDFIGSNHSFNIKNIQQLYSFLRKNKSSFTKYNMQSWHYNRHIHFNIEFEHLFLREYGKSNNTLKKVSFDLNKVNKDYFHFFNSLCIFELEDFKEMDASIKLELYQILKHKLSINEVSFHWDEYSIGTLIENNSFIFGKTDKSKNEFYNVLVNILNNNSLNKELLILLMLNDIEVYGKLQNHINSNSIVLFDKPKYIKKDEIMPNNNRTYIKFLEDKFSIYKETDAEIIKVVEQIIESTDLLENPKGLCYFAENMEEKLNYDKVIQHFLPKILANYFALPLSTRNSEENNFFIMTMTQLSKIEKEVINWQKKVLADEEKNMRIFGRFLDDKFPTESNIINIR